VIGATTIYGLAWLVVLVVPMLATVQAISAAVGAVSRKGLEDCIRTRFGRGWALLAMASIVAVGLLTLAADLAGGAAAIEVMVNVDYRWFILPFAAFAAVLLVRGRYETIEGVLKYLALVFFAYVASAIAARPDWGRVLRDTVMPHWHWTSAYTGGAIALLGTTLTAYAYVWETIEVSHERPPLRRLGLVQADAALGMVFAGISFFFIVIGTGATLGVQGKMVHTAQDAAAALYPIAGHYAALLFGVGLLASALLAVPVLAGTNAYVMAEMFGWRASLDSSFARARAFYTTLLLSLAVATGIAYIGIPPIQLLFASSIAGGFATPITLTLMLLIAGDEKMMGRPHRVRGPLLVAGWAVDAVVVTACAIFLYQLLTGNAS
jgi:Mn2+/Fe2+ NRAMP family transporter